MIKFLVGSVIILALVGGAIEFKSTDKDYSLVMNKETAKVSVYNGVIKIYDLVKELIDNNVNTETTNQVGTKANEAK